MRKISILLMGLFISFSGFTQSWSLTGNAGTNPPTNFLGTTDNNRLVFKADATEYATILTNGNFGIGTTAPVYLLHAYSTAGANQGAFSGTNPAIRFFQGSTVVSGSALGTIALATGANNFVSGAAAGDFIVQQSDTMNAILFSVGQTSGGNGMERMRINKIGYVGIAQQSPTAKFDVNCVAVTGQTNPSNIRFENLQSGKGSYLVIDSSGYVYRDTAATGGAMANTPLVSGLQGQIEDLQNQVQELRSLLSSRLALSAAEQKQLSNESAGWLGDIHPNPANNSTTIDYSLPSGVGAATCQIYALNGNIVTAISLPAAQGKSQVQVNTSQLAQGMYIYALVADGKVLDSKKLVVAR
jgi:Secretion system C-terminal sorting domain